MEPIEDDLHLAALADLLAAQASGLHRVFARAFGDMLLGRTRSFRDVGRALKAQNQCRIALRVLLALRAAEQARKKFRNRTNRLLEEENHHHDQDLGQPPTESPPLAQPKRDLSPEARRAKGEGGLDPRAPGKAGRAHPHHQTLAAVDKRAASETMLQRVRGRAGLAVLRSRTGRWVREERQLVRDAAATIALAKTFLRLAARSISGQRVTVWTGDPDLDGCPVQPDRPGKPL